MQNVKKYFPWFVRILISGLFLLSAFAKIYPDPSFYFSITAFEFKQLVPMGFTMETAVYFSRIIIGIEFAIGILLLFPYNIKKFIIPATILMLAVFSVHLIIEILTGGNQGNCGCFGALLPMTPLQALIKNLLSIGLLTLVLYKFSNELVEKNNILITTNITTLCILALFMLIPIQKKTTVSPSPTGYTEDSTIVKDSIIVKPITDSTKKDDVVIKDTTKKIIVVAGPKKVKSIYSKYFPKIDDGKKILCFFAPTCDHCMATAKELTELKKADPNFPDIQMIFMDEAAEEIPKFFKFAGAEYPNLVLDIIAFWGALGKTNDTPGVVYLWNGNVQKFYNGTEKDKFNKVEFKKIVKK
ncbi:MAG: protein tlpB [Flavobacteriia bacterium]|nr:protein tlpB [Flavobacteriia bacterium]